MKDLITVIIPAFNVEKYLANCLETIVSQTHQNLQIIIINDGSKDKTGKIAAEFALKDHRINVIHQQNQGVSAARNKGLQLATGDYIGFLDGDDEIAKDMYEFLYHNLKKYQADISHCGFELVKPSLTVKFHDTGIVLVQSKFEAIKELLTGARIEPSACTKLFKKAILENVFFATDIKINEDLLFNIEAFKKAETIVFEDVVKYKYTFNPVSASRSSQVVDRVEDLLEVAKRIKSLLPETEIKEAVNQFYVGKLLTNLKLLKQRRLFSTTLAKNHRQELRANNTKNMGLRTRTLKSLLLDFSFFYEGFICFYNIFFAKNQKWK